jgi:hypothetical protein
MNMSGSSEYLEVLKIPSKRDNTLLSASSKFKWRAVTMASIIVCLTESLLFGLSVGHLLWFGNPLILGIMTSVATVLYGIYQSIQIFRYKSNLHCFLALLCQKGFITLSGNAQDEDETLKIKNDLIGNFSWGEVKPTKMSIGVGVIIALIVGSCCAFLAFKAFLNFLLLLSAALHLATILAFTIGLLTMITTTLLAFVFYFRYVTCKQYQQVTDTIDKITNTTLQSKTSAYGMVGVLVVIGIVVLLMAMMISNSWWLQAPEFLNIIANVIGVGNITRFVTILGCVGYIGMLLYTVCDYATSGLALADTAHDLCFSKK